MGHVVSMNQVMSDEQMPELPCWAVAIGKSPRQRKLQYHKLDRYDDFVRPFCEGHGAIRLFREGEDDQYPVIKLGDDDGFGVKLEFWHEHGTLTATEWPLDRLVTTVGAICKYLFRWVDEGWVWEMICGAITASFYDDKEVEESVKVLFELASLSPLERKRDPFIDAAIAHDATRLPGYKKVDELPEVIQPDEFPIMNEKIRTGAIDFED